MSRKTSTKRAWVTLVLWATALYACLLVGLNFALSRGCEAWRNWNAGGPPAGGPEAVRRLEEYKERHGHFPATLSEVGPVDGLPDEDRVSYHLIDGSGARDFRLSIGVYDKPDCAFDSHWTYESRKGRWVYWSMLQSGG